MISAWPAVQAIDESVLKSFTKAEEVITNIRNVRKQHNIANKVKIELFIKKNTEIDASFDAVILKMGNLSLLEYSNDKVNNANSFFVDGNEYYIPFGESIDVEAEKKKITDELEYTKGFLQSVQRKLQNEKFMAGAPDQVVAMERKKEADAMSTIAVLEEKLTSLN
jgi:valyl-tRNA synthetase